MVLGGAGNQTDVVTHDGEWLLYEYGFFNSAYAGSRAYYTSTIYLGLTVRDQHTFGGTPYVDR